jgi:16S rRNA (guanine1207-N2)-methyltransferase
MPHHLVYGSIPHALSNVPSDAQQVSPLMPGGSRLEEIMPASAARIMLLAPPGTIERRYTLALALRALRSDGELTALGPKDKGGARLRRELEGFGCLVAEDARKHWRICRVLAPSQPEGLEEALAAGRLQQHGEAARWTQPGIFSW